MKHVFKALIPKVKIVLRKEKGYGRSNNLPNNACGIVYCH